MTDQTISAENQPVSPSQRLRNIGILFSALAVIILLLAGGYAYHQQLKIDTFLNNMLIAAQAKIKDQDQQLVSLQQSIKSLQQFAEKSQALSQQQEQMLAEWQAAQKKDLNKWRLAEAQYLVKMANDHLQFAKDSTVALNLLMRANQVLDALQEVNLLELKKSLLTDINELQAAPQINTTDLYLQLSALDTQIDVLPFANHALTANAEDKTEKAREDASWWRKGLDRSWQALSKIVIVRYNGSQALPLLLPEEKSFLYQNLHAKMENALWAVLHRNNAVYQASLLQIDTWVKEYFDQNALQTKAMLQAIAALNKINIDTPKTNFANTLQLFDKALQ